jgi:hypothetical protein
MRASAATVVGLLAGGALGFLMRGLFVEDASRAEASGVAQPAADDAARAALPNVPPSAAEPLATEIATSSTAIAAEPGTSDAADALVGIVVYGALTEPDGTPAQLGDRRWLYFDNGRGGVRTIQLSTSTYAVSGLVAGSCRIRTDLSGYRTEKSELELAAAQPAVRVDIVLQPSVELMIKAFTPSGERLDQALEASFESDPWSMALSAVATREPPPAALPEISYRIYEQWGIGRYQAGFELMVRSEAMPDDVIGKLELDESLPAYVSLMFRHLVVQTQRVEPGATEVAFVVPVETLTALLGGVRLKVVDAETRQPLVKAMVELSDSQSSGGGRAPDAEGVVTWERQRPGRLELQISAPDHEQWNGEVSVPAGGVADLGTIELTPATSVSGVVLDEAGQPVSVQLRALVDEERELGMGARSYNRSGADGRFECKSLGRRRYVLMASDEDWTGLPVPVDLRQGNVGGVVVHVAKGTRVRLHSQWVGDGTCDVRLIASDGLELWSIEGWLGDWSWAKRLVPGEYIAILARGGVELKRVAFRVGTEDLSVELAL